ncbi:MAG: lipopolysaccharide assembly protein LapA domain-containing protein [Proteobacteria bacterium]|nr:lipopolysaccharide assembly protein LapA domain-containing protein [Pseudomonadota bacterium]
MLLLKRLTVFIVALVVIVVSITISGLNTEKVVVDLYFVAFDISLGFALILTLFIGLLIGLLMALFSFYMPLKSQMRKLSRKNKQLLEKKRIELSND